jgi:hypothetical protein
MCQVAGALTGANATTWLQGKGAGTISPRASSSPFYWNTTTTGYVIVDLGKI